mmetsp:Transcript_84978/g.263984  ORF Transcript_84978/g.263984 Transcript_84978/m.263984 type:complete len:230 (-) Transcript_84978:2-691(-)
MRFRVSAGKGGRSCPSGAAARGPPCSRILHPVLVFPVSPALPAPEGRAEGPGHDEVDEESASGSAVVPMGPWPLSACSSSASRRRAFERRIADAPSAALMAARKLAASLDDIAARNAPLTSALELPSMDRQRPRAACTLPAAAANAVSPGRLEGSGARAGAPPGREGAQPHGTLGLRTSGHRPRRPVPAGAPAAGTPPSQSPGAGEGPQCLEKRARPIQWLEMLRASTA